MDTRHLRPACVFTLALAVAACMGDLGTPSPSVVGGDSASPTGFVGAPAPPATSRSTPASPSATAASSGVPTGGRWVDAGRIDPEQDVARAWPHLVALPDGSALLLGSDNRCSPGSVVVGDGRHARRFDASGGWLAAGALNKDRGAFVLLTLDDGRVLVASGANADEGPSFSSTKLWSPAANDWSDGPALDHARTDAFGVVLADGRVMTGGGTYYDGVHVARALASVEAWDPTRDRWSPTASMPVALGFATAVRLDDGIVLVVGSRDPASFDPGFEPVALLYDPGADRWAPLPSPGPGWDAELVALAGGDALFVSATMQRLDRGSGTWRQIPTDRPLEHAQVVTLPSGRVLFAGGQAPDGPADDSWPALDRTDLLDPLTESWTRGPTLPAGRQDGEMVLLADGSVLYAGGAGAGNPTAAPSCPDAIDTAARFLPDGS